ncbi:MAG: hypothetical protein Q7S40_04255 [Opitutaceae bacterium]|nr:hypothetical protein [Opitutaceae bacterium]
MQRAKFDLVRWFFAYLLAIATHPEEVKSRPSAWLPWNYPPAETSTALHHDPPARPAWVRTLASAPLCRRAKKIALRTLAEATPRSRVWDLRKESCFTRLPLGQISQEEEVNSKA